MDGDAVNFEVRIVKTTNHRISRDGKGEGEEKVELGMLPGEWSWRLEVTGTMKVVVSTLLF